MYMYREGSVYFLKTHTIADIPIPSCWNLRPRDHGLIRDHKRNASVISIKQFLEDEDQEMPVEVK